MTTCKHDGLYWYAAPATERGWKCVDCDWQPGEPPGFAPLHDRELLPTKVHCILQDLDTAEIVYVGSGSNGESIVAAASRVCRERDVYDSVSIARVLLEVMGGDIRAAFWREMSEGVLTGNDKRERCHCGVLANVYTGGKSFCMEHVPGWEELS